MRVAVGVLAALAASWCSSSKPPSPPGAAGPGQVEPEGPVAAPLPEPGEVLEATVPLLGGGGQELAQLRGRVVVLDIASSVEPGWVEAQERWRALVDELGEDRLAVVSVAVDPDPQHLRQQWDRDPPPFILAWDPQGALPLRLGLSSLPTTIVLDQQGRELLRTTDHEQPTLGRIESVIVGAAQQPS